ncbi:MAG: hypothetical protein RIR11_3478 [Bacteroidota bacterium]|jgi:hypothetical protein
MTKYTFRTALIGLLIAVFATVNFAQSTTFLDFEDNKKKKKKKKEKTEFKDKLWYGAGVGLGFSAFNGERAFGLSLAPMVGYKIIPRISVGPRVSLSYTSQKVFGYKAFQLLDTEIGAFLRVHAFRGFFLQGELSRGWDQELYLSSNGEIFKDSAPTINPYVGLGYNYSRGEGGPGQEISLMYNFRIANDINTNETPIQFRLAFTFGF